MNSIAAAYPLLTAIVLVVVGFAAAAVLSWLTGRLIVWFDRRLRRISPQATTFTPQFTRLLKRSVYIGTVGLFALLAVGALGPTELLSSAFGGLPGVFAGVLVILVGYLAALFVFQLLTATLGTGAGSLVPRLAQLAVFAVAMLTGLTAMSIDVSFLGQSIIVVLLVTLGGLSLSFALGSRAYVANLLARRVFSEFSVGDRIRLGELEGVVLDFTTTSVLIRTDEGVAVVPASRFSESVVVRLTHQ